MVETTRKNNTMWQRICGALARIRPCCTATPTSDGDRHNEEPFDRAVGFHDQSGDQAGSSAPNLYTADAHEHLGRQNRSLGKPIV